MSGIGRIAWGLPQAVGFLTVVPVPRPMAASASAGPFDLGMAVMWFPVVGAAVGAAGGGVRLGLSSVFGPGVASALAIATMVVLTGALHQDALADTCDGLGVRRDRERRLAVMRDSTLGAFGVLAVVLWALTEYAALETLSADHALRALIVAGAVSRLAALLHGMLASSARSDGLGATLRATPVRTLVAAISACAITVAAAGPARAGLSLAVAAAAALLTAVGARRAVGGSTGDTLGATVLVTEVAVCVALLASWR